MESSGAEAQIEDRIQLALNSEPQTWTPHCLSPEQIIALVDRAVPEGKAVSLMAHIALCARCRREYAETVELVQLAAEVQQLEAEAEKLAASSPARATPEMSAVRSADTEGTVTALQSPPRSSFWQRWASLKWALPGMGFALGAAAAAVLFFALMIPMRAQRDAEQRQLAAVRAARETEVAHAAQEKHELEQELAGLIRSNSTDTTRLAKELDRVNLRARIQGVQIARLSETADTLRQIPLPIPAWRLSEGVRMRGNPGVMNPVTQIVLIRPVNTALDETRPTLECRPVPGASAYEVSLEQEDTNEDLPAPKALSRTRWQVEAALQPGKVYRWMVTARRGSERLRSLFVKFYILSEAQRRAIASARHDYAHDPLTLGAVYARVGMREEAAQQFRAVLHNDPAQPVAGRWLKEIEEDSKQ